MPTTGSYSAIPSLYPRANPLYGTRQAGLSHPVQYGRLRNESARVTVVRSKHGATYDLLQHSSFRESAVLALARRGASGQIFSDGEDLPRLFGDPLGLCAAQRVLSASPIPTQFGLLQLPPPASPGQVRFLPRRTPAACYSPTSASTPVGRAHRPACASPDTGPGYDR